MVLHVYAHFRNPLSRKISRMEAAYRQCAVPVERSVLRSASRQYQFARDRLYGYLQNSIHQNRLERRRVSKTYVH